MSSRLCLSAIKVGYQNLTSTEKKVADYILENYEKVIMMSVSELSQNAGVVKSAVIRFCKSIGFSGYTELKLSLSRELARNEQFNYTPYIGPQDTTSDILNKIFSANIKTLHDTAEGIDRKSLEGVVSTFYNAKNIYVYGVGTSSGIAADFQYRLMQLGFTTFCFTDITAIKASALNIKKDDVAIGISNSGRTIATVDALKLAHEKGAKTVCLTSYPKSEITKQSDYPIVIFTDEILSYRGDFSEDCTHQRA